MFLYEKFFILGLDFIIVIAWMFTERVIVAFTHVWASIEYTFNKVSLVRLYFLSMIRETLKAINKNWDYTL